MFEVARAQVGKTGRMCGIFGVVGQTVSDRTLKQVLQLLRHRGPDGNGSFVDERARLTLAHTRLAVVDLATGGQPMQSEDGGIVLAANGEIYGFESIRSSLEAKGHRFRSKSDSEVIVYLYKEYGLDCFEHLRGEFAFLLYDKSKGLLIAARDRFGIKPLYFARLPHGFVFASEMKAIFGSDLVAPELNVAAFDPLIEHDPDNPPFPFERIEHVPPASYLVIDVESLELRATRYWSAEIPDQAAEPVAKPNGDLSEPARSVLRHLEESVRLRLRADVPVGLYLSGGIDSSFVAALMKRNLKSPPHSFSISFAGSDKDELQFARRAADFIGTTHHELVVTKELLWQNLEEALWYSELPFVTLAPVGKFLLSYEARKHVTVVLTGEGADEVFLGYRSYFQNAIRDTREGHSDMNLQRRRLKLPRLAEKMSLLIFQQKHRRRLALLRAAASVPRNVSKPVINAVQEARLAAMPLDILCFLGDREEMAHSLEARLPFLDHKLYDAAKWMGVDVKMRGDLEKAVLRDAAKGILPEDLRMRRKSGFMMTSEAVEFFRADSRMTDRSRRSYLSREAFENAQIFSYRAYRLLTLAARLPTWKRLPVLRRTRRNANKVLMYMAQVHMLKSMFIDAPRWKIFEPGVSQLVPGALLRGSNELAERI